MFCQNPFSFQILMLSKFCFLENFFALGGEGRTSVVHAGTELNYIKYKLLSTIIYIVKHSN